MTAISNLIDTGIDCLVASVKATAHAGANVYHLANGVIHMVKEQEKLEAERVQACLENAKFFDTAGLLIKCGACLCPILVLTLASQNRFSYIKPHITLPIVVGWLGHEVCKLGEGYKKAAVEMSSRFQSYVICELTNLPPWWIDFTDAIQSTYFLRIVKPLLKIPVSLIYLP